VLRVIDRGTSSIQDLLTSVIFNILPALLDITIGVVYFGVRRRISFWPTLPPDLTAE